MLLHETRRVTQSRVARGNAEPGPPLVGARYCSSTEALAATWPEVPAS
jgi:hypothetical protein